MMGLVSPYQYVWSSIQGPLGRDLGVSFPALGFVFTLYVIFQSGSQFPSVVAEYYGQEHSSANYAMLYSAKMVGGLFGGGVIGWLVASTSWSLAFLVGGALAIAAGLGALVLRPPTE